MRERTVPFLVFADLAFFLFAILALSFQYVQIVESGDTKIFTDSFLVDLVRMPFSKNQDRVAAQKNTTDTVEVAVLKDGTFLLNGALVAHNELEAAFRPFDEHHCRLFVDRLAQAEALVLVLGLLEEQRTKSIEIEFIPQEKKEILRQD